MLSAAEAQRLETWFVRRYPNSNPAVLKNGGKWNLVLTRNGAVFNFHVAVQPAHA